MCEQWKSIPGYPGYEVSDQGRVRSYKKKLSPKKGWGISDKPQRILKPSVGGNGYLCLRLSNNGKTKYFAIARLVLETFVGSPPEGMEVCHNNGDPHDNRLKNLRYDTHEANMLDASNHNAWGENIETEIIPETKVEIDTVPDTFGEQLRVLRISQGLTQVDLASKVGISDSYVSYIETGNRNCGEELKQCIFKAFIERKDP